MFLLDIGLFLGLVSPSNPASFTCVYEANSIEQDDYSCGYIV